MVAARAFALALGALAAVFLAACRSEPAPQTSLSGEVARSIILVTVDTLRADRLGSYGSTRGLTPALDRFAQGAARFTAAVTAVPLTLPAHATILTGLHPATHGVRTNDGFRLGAGVPTLAEALRARGYATGAFIGGYPLQASFGLARGFERYDDDFLRAAGKVERPADEVVTAAVAWIEQHQSQPFFAWLHLFDPHSPYTPPAPFAPTRSEASDEARYDGEIAYTDAALGRLFDRLQHSALFARTAFFVAADHGESLGEHGERTHGTFLYDATVRVPLLIRLPAQTAPLSIAVPVEVADLAPTIAAAAGASLGAVDGLSLLPLLQPASALRDAGRLLQGRLGGPERPAPRETAAGDPDRPAYVESYYQNVLLGWSPLRAVRTSRWKFIEAPRPELYDLEADPGELTNRVADRPALAAGLRRALPLTGTDASATPAPAVDGDSAERLRSLGYVSGSTLPSAAARAVDPKDRVAVWAAIEDGIDRLGRDPHGARQAFARALRLDPGNGLAMKYLADVSFRAGEQREARDGYRRAIAAGFRHPDAFVNLAAIEEHGGRLDAARAALLEAVKIGRGDADAWNRLGLLEARRGAADQARRAFTSAMAAEPGRAEPYYNLAIIERRAGNETVAQARLLEALARNPSYPEAHYELGTGYLLARQPEPALKAYRAALDARPDYAEALFGAARAALDLGRSDEARRDYERFVQIAPPEYRQQITAAREALRRLNAPHP